MQRTLIFHGFLLIGLGLITGFLIPLTELPRLALSAHSIGVLSGALLLAIASIWSFLNHTSAQKQTLLAWLWIIAGYANWLGCLVGAFLGAGDMTPLASQGVTGTHSAEIIVKLLLGSTAVASLLAVALSLHIVWRKLR